MTKSRIPPISGKSRKSAIAWLKAMQSKRLMFCIDDDPQTVMGISDGQRTFSDDEASEVSKVLADLFSFHGDALYEWAFLVISKGFHTPEERLAFRAQYV